MMDSIGCSDGPRFERADRFATLTRPRSTESVEGRATRQKRVKRQIPGRTGLGNRERRSLPAR